MSTGRLHLAVGVNSTGYVGSSWSWPGTRWNRFADFEHYLHVTRLAREGVLDAVFVSDHTALMKDPTQRPLHSLDPIVLFSALAAAVPDIGFILTASSTYNSPYNLARRLASLDAVSGGRLVWNVVSSFNPDIAANFGAAPLPERAERYRRAEEFLEVVRALWLSWDTPGDEPPGGPDGPLWTPETARRIDHHGEFFDVAGPLNVPVGPQGHPVIGQAGASSAGIDLVARHAEVVYAPILSLGAARDYRARLTASAQRHGHDPGTIRLLPGLVPIVGDTREEALRRHEALHGVSDDDALVADFARRAGLDPDAVGPDDLLDPGWFPWDDEQLVPVGFVRAYADLAAHEKVTVREAARRYESGHRLVVGTAEEVAQDILRWWRDGTVDGFTLQPAVLPDDLERFVHRVVPLLQDAGALPRAYEHATMRERLGLPFPTAG